jgi:hypothetical protein
MTKIAASREQRKVAVSWDGSRQNAIRALRRQAAQCLSFGSPFNAALIAAAADALARTSLLSDILNHHSLDTMPTALPFRLAGALHAAVLSGQDAELADKYPRTGYPGDGNAAWNAAEDFIARNPDWLDEWLKLPPQTNEIARSAGLFAGILAIAGRHRLPLELLELGASAGLNLNMERFHYQPNGWHWGAESPVRIDSQWLGGAPPYLGPVTIQERAGCDQYPLDVTDPKDRLRLSAYVWPDQPDRLARLRAAMDLAVVHGTRVERADAADWIEQRLAKRASGCTTVVYHSIFQHYPPRDVRARVAVAIRGAGAKATNESPLAWLRFEFDGSDGREIDNPRCILDLMEWPGGDHRVLAEVDSHGRFVRWLDHPAPRTGQQET